MRSATTHGKIARRSRRIVTDTSAAQSERQQVLRTPTPPGRRCRGKTRRRAGSDGGQEQALGGWQALLRRRGIGDRSGVRYGGLASRLPFHPRHVLWQIHTLKMAARGRCEEDEGNHHCGEGLVHRKVFAKGMVVPLVQIISLLLMWFSLWGLAQGPGCRLSAAWRPPLARGTHANFVPAQSMGEPVL